MAEDPVFGREDPTDVTAVVQRRRFVLSRDRWLLVLGIVFGLSALVSIGAALYLGYRNKSQPPGDSEEPLALYSYANELFVTGEDAASLRVLRRAKRITTDERALAQIHDLERRIVDTRRLQALRADEDENSAPAGGTRTPSPPVRRSDGEPERSDGEASTAAAKAEHRATTSAVPSGAANQAPKEPRSVTAARPTRSANGTNHGWIAISSSIEGQIWIDGSPTNRLTPARLRLPAGRHTLALESTTNPQRRMSRHVRVLAGRVRHVRIELPLQANSDTTKADVVRQPKPVERTQIGTIDSSRSKAAIGLIGATDPLPATPPAEPAE